MWIFPREWRMGKVFLKPYQNLNPPNVGFVPLKTPPPNEILSL